VTWKLFGLFLLAVAITGVIVIVLVWLGDHNALIEL
jgi:hypothetical protein